MSTVRLGKCVDVHVGETLLIELPGRTVDSEKICITLLHKSGQKARLQIKADESVTIGRPAGRKTVPAL